MKKRHHQNIEEADQARYLQAMVDLLEHVQQEPARFREQSTLVESLQSQGKLCRLSMPDIGLFAVSLNTFKRYCQRHVAGGFDALDRRRKAARTAIERCRRVGPTARKTQKGLIGELQADNAQLTLDNLLLTKLLQVSMRQARFYATTSGTPSLMALHDKEQREMLDLLSCVRSDTRGG
jgi:hypothetical protein